MNNKPDIRIDNVFVTYIIRIEGDVSFWMCEDGKTRKMKISDWKLAAQYPEHPHMFVDPDTKLPDFNFEPIGLSPLQINQECYRNLYKSHYGINPRHLTLEQWNDVEFLDKAIADLGNLSVEGN